MIEQVEQAAECLLIRLGPAAEQASDAVSPFLPVVAQYILPCFGQLIGECTPVERIGQFRDPAFLAERHRLSADRRDVEL